MGREEFRLNHYAGEVNYNVNGELFDKGQGETKNLRKLVFEQERVLIFSHIFSPC